MAALCIYEVSIIISVYSSPPNLQHNFSASSSFALQGSLVYTTHKCGHRSVFTIFSKDCHITLMYVYIHISNIIYSEYIEVREMCSHFTEVFEVFSRHEDLKDRVGPWAAEALCEHWNRRLHGWFSSALCHMWTCIICKGKLMSKPVWTTRSPCGTWETNI